MAEKIRPSEQMLELSEDEALSGEQLDSQVQKAQEQLVQLKRARPLVVLEREAYNAQKRLEQIRSTRESFGQHLELIEAIDPRGWNPTDLHKELSRALSTVEDARTEFSQQRSRLQVTEENAGDVSLPEIGSGPYELNGGRSFVQWMQIGFAFSLPLIILGLIALAIFFWLASRGS